MCLNEDYLMPAVDMEFAKISHNVNILAKEERERVQILISRDCPPLLPVLEIYENSYDIFGAFVKDFVRNHIYPHISPFIPSSTKQGAEALRRVLAQKRELYRYEWSDVGDMEPLISNFMSGKIGFGEVLKKSHAISRSQTQRVRSNQVGGVEKEIPDLAQTSPPANQERQDSFGPAPSLLRTNAPTDMKVLTTERAYQDNSREPDVTKRLHRSPKRSCLVTRVSNSGHRVIGKRNLFHHSDWQNKDSGY